MATKAETAQAAQTGLAAVMARDVDQAWHLLDPADMQTTLPKFKLAVAALVRKYGLASGALAAEFYAEQRREAKATTRYATKVAAPAPTEQVDKAIDWATRGLWQPSPNVASAKVMSTGVAEKMVLDVGRRTVINTARGDRAARGWARVPEPGCCSFCAMLATRGAVYKDGSFDNANAKFLSHEDTPSDIKTHDHCRCHAEPVFTAYEPTAQVRQWQHEWREVTKDATDPRLAWRHHFENRTP